MRVTLTKADTDVLVGLVLTSDLPPDRVASLVGKLSGTAKTEPGAAVRPLEEALLTYASVKAVALTGGHARVSRQAAQVGATVDDMEIVGDWLLHQGWLHDPVTLLTVLNKWHEWLPRAKAWYANMGSVPHTGGSKPPKGRRPPGFG